MKLWSIAENTRISDSTRLMSMKLWSIAEKTRISDVALNQVNVNEARGP